MQSVGKRGRALDYAHIRTFPSWAEGLEEMVGGTFKIGIKKTYSWGGEVFNYECVCGVKGRLKTLEVGNEVVFEESGEHSATCPSVTGETEKDQTKYRGLSIRQRKLCADLYERNFTTTGRILSRMKVMLHNDEIKRDDIPMKSKLNTYMPQLKQRALSAQGGSISANLESFNTYATTNNLQSLGDNPSLDVPFVCGWSYDADRQDCAMFRMVISTLRCSYVLQVCIPLFYSDIMLLCCAVYV
jgi:hypothetical protein